MKKPLTNTSASIRARLLNLSRSNSRDFQELTTRYTVERFLARLVRSEHRERFILKGAMLYIPWKLDEKRTTMDLDLLGLGKPEIADLKTSIQEICDIAIEEDGLIFKKESLTATQIRKESVYEGVRINVNAKLGSMNIRLQIDVGFGDQVVPEPRIIEFPPLLAEKGPVLRSYSPETVIAEKFNAMVVLGMANSRMKDYFDIWMLSQNFCLEAKVLREAISKTFEKRKIALPVDVPIALDETFFLNASKQSQWKGFVRKQKRIESAPSLEKAVKVLRKFLLPILFGMQNDVIKVDVWSPENGWSSR